MRLSKLALYGISLWAISTSSAAQQGPAAGEPLPGSAEHVMQMLDNAIWIADGKVASKQIYIIAAPWCPYCAELYRNSRLIGNQVQLRWIESDARDDYNADFIGEIAKTPTAQILLAMYGPTRVAHADAGPIAKRADAYNSGVALAIRALTPNRKGGIPVLIWLDAAGTYHVENRAHLAEAIKSVVPRPWAAEVRPIGFEMMQITRVLPTHRNASVYVAGPVAHLYWAPSTKAPIVMDLTKNEAFVRTYKLKSLVKSDGQSWIEIERSTPTAAEEYGWFLRAEDVTLVGAP